MSGTMALPASAADNPPVCTQIGCISGVLLSVERLPPETTRLVFCVDHRCTRARLRGKAPGAKVKCEAGETAVVTVTARDRDRKLVARVRKTIPLEAHQPNGPSCPPTCYGASVELDGRKLRVN
jgi:hypothetical protein